jgi:DNA-binding transcriptional MerR regulator
MPRQNIEHFDVGAKHAAQITDITVKTLIVYADKGLIPCIRSSTGHRLFRRSDLERFNRERLKSDPSKVYPRVVQ